MYIAGMVIGTLVTYAFGTIWLAYQAHMNFAAALMAGVIPYLPGDAAKILIAVLVGSEVRKRLIQSSLIRVPAK